MNAQFPYPIKEALRLFGWVGTPRLVWKGAVIDGRQRTEALEELGLARSVPTHTATSPRDAARRLIAAGHYSRAEKLGLFPFDPRDTATCLQWAGLDKPSKGTPSKRVHEPRVRARAIEALREVVAKAEERGDRTVPLFDVKEILKRWL